MALKNGLGGGTTDNSTFHDEINGSQLVTSTDRIYFRDSGIYIYSNADGKLTISTDAGGADDISITGGITMTGALTQTGNLDVTGNAEINLSTADGSTGLVVKDTDGFTVAEIDSSGNLKLKGKVQRVSAAGG